MSMENVSNQIEEVVEQGQQAVEELATEAQESVDNAVTVKNDKGFLDKCAEAAAIWKPVVKQVGKVALIATGGVLIYKAVDSYIQKNRKEVEGEVIDGEFEINE